jgi:hypothetical protein
VITRLNAPFGFDVDASHALSTRPTMAAEVSRSK